MRHYDIVYIIKFRNSQGILFMKFPQNFNLTKFEISVAKLPIRYYDIAYIIKFRNSQGILFMESPQNC